MRNKLPYRLNFFLYLIIFCAGCNEQRITYVFPVKQGENFKKDILLDKKGELGYDYHYIKKNVKLYKLQDIEDGFDSIYIRLWFTYSFERRQQLIELSKSNGKWTGNFFVLTSIFSENDSLIKIEKEIQQKKPNSKWSKIEEKLFELKFTDLQDCKLINGYNFSTDGNAITIEIATKNYYKIFSYASPKANQQFPAAKTIEKIILLIEKEFEFKSFRPI